MNKLVVNVLLSASAILSVALPALLVMVPADEVKFLIVLLKPPKSSKAPEPTLKVLLVLSPLVLPARSVPALTVVAPL